MINTTFKKPRRGILLASAALLSVLLQPKACLSADADEDFTENYEGFKTYMAEYHAKAFAAGKADGQPRIRELEASNGSLQQQIATLTAQLQAAQSALDAQAERERKAAEVQTNVFKKRGV
jgi:Tfp pilus assembly protein FimV